MLILGARFDTLAEQGATCVGIDEPFDEKMKRLVVTLAEQFAEGARLEKEIRKNLRGIGYGG